MIPSQAASAYSQASHPTGQSARHRSGDRRLALYSQPTLRSASWRPFWSATKTARRRRPRHSRCSRAMFPTSTSIPSPTISVSAGDGAAQPVRWSRILHLRMRGQEVDLHSPVRRRRKFWEGLTRSLEAGRTFMTHCALAGGLGALKHQRGTSSTMDADLQTRAGRNGLRHPPGGSPWHSPAYDFSTRRWNPQAKHHSDRGRGEHPNGPVRRTVRAPTVSTARAISMVFAPPTLETW